jgi:hypothetical protein
MISCFINIKNPLVAEEIDVYEFIEQIKQPDQPILNLINEAREYYVENPDLYKTIKESLPCFTLNFSFNHRKVNDNIKAPTGFIYLDLDNKTDIDLTNELIFVTWRSISNNGRGILVKASGLTINNFKKTYISIAKELGLEVDKHANKPTQYCIHSYDKDIYLNNDSITWKCINEEIKNTPTKSILLKENKDSTKVGVFPKLRFNNIDDYDFNGKDYLYFENDKEEIAEVFIPKRIEKGGRNTILSAIANQIKALNPLADFDDYNRLLISINLKHCKPSLKDNEVSALIYRNFKNKESIFILNKSKRFLFNPKSNLSKKEKTHITAPIMGQRKSSTTLEEIRDVLKKWDIKEQGKVTIKSLITKTGKCKNTIEKYYKNFKDLRTEINNNFMLLNRLK